MLKKGKLSIIGENYYKNNTLYIKKDVKYPLTDMEVNSLMLKYELVKKRNFKSGDKAGVVKVYLGDKSVYKENIYVKVKGKH